MNFKIVLLISMFIMSKVMAFIDIKRDLVQWKFLLLNIAKKPSCQGGDSYEFAKNKWQ